MNHTTLPDDLGELLSAIYGTLKQHAQSIYNRQIEMMAVAATLRELIPGFDTVYQHHRREALESLQSQFETQERLLDEIIERLRST